MNDEQRPFAWLRTNIVVSGILLAGFITMSILVFMMSNIFGNAATALEFIFTALSIVTSGIFFASIKIHHDRKAFYEALLEENYYTLGERMAFYNLDAFKQ